MHLVVLMEKVQGACRLGQHGGRPVNFNVAVTRHVIIGFATNALFRVMSKGEDVA